MAPPAPPRSVAMRRTASAATRKAPTTLMSSRRRSSARGRSATVDGPPFMPALLTTPRTGPKRCTAVSNSRVTSASDAVSACTANAWPPASAMLATTASAASRRSR